MPTVTGASLRLLLATLAGACLLLGIAGNANAAVFADLRDADPGDAVALSPSVTIDPGTVTAAGDTLELSGATLSYGDIGSGEGVTGVATADTLTLRGGTFTFAEEVATGEFTIDADKPLTFSLDGSDESTGSLIPAASQAPAAVQAFAGIGQGDAEDAALGLLPTVPADNGPTFYTIDVACCGSNSLGLNLRQKQRQPNGAVVETGRVLVAVNLLNRRYRVEVINWQFKFRGSTATLSAVVPGLDILNPFEFTGVTGSITGEVELADGVYFTGGTLRWDKNGFTVNGGARVDCVTGSVGGQLSGTIVDNDDWSFSLTGATNGGCVVSDDLQLPTGDLTGEIASEAGAITGLFEVGGIIQTTLLPDGADEWDARFRFIYDGTDAGSYVGFYAAADIGVAQGIVRFDGTFALNADFTVPFGGSNVAFDGDIKRETPGGAVVYDVGGSANIVFGKGTLAGSLRLTNDELAFTGNVSVDCPVSGGISGAVATTVPLTGGNTWSVGISGGAPTGCGVTNEFSLGAGTGITGEVKSVNGVVSVSADANATVNTTLIPTKSSFSAGFKFAASQGAYNVAVNGSTQGAGFSAAVASNGTFDLSFNLSDLALGGVTLGANGTIKRTTPGGAVAYTISGSLAGQAKIYDNLYLRGGSLSISNTGGLRFSGTVRQMCTTGYLDASASGAIVDSRNWSFDAQGLASSCTLGRAAKFNGTTFFADIDSVNNKVTYNAGVAATQLNLFSTSFLLIGKTTTWLTNVSATIGNTCAGCQEGGKNRITFRGTGNAKFTLLFIPTTVSATVDGVFDFSGTTIRRVDIRITKIGWNIFTAGVQAALVSALDCDVEKGFTTA